MNPTSGSLYRLPEEHTPPVRLDDGPPEPAPSPDDLAPVRVCSAVHRSGVHVVDEEAPDATLCGREVGAVYQHLPERKVARPCGECQDELHVRVIAGEWMRSDA